MKKALVLAFALVLGLGIAAFGASPLSGSWSSSITFSPISPFTVDTFTSTLIVDYTVGGWTFKSTTGFDKTGWTTQEFTANGTLGAFTLSSDLVFAPASAAFTSWKNTGKVSIAGVDLSSEFLLKNYGSGIPGTGWTFGASSTAGDLTLGATAYFNMNSSGELIQTESNCFCFSSVEFTASFPFACIDKVSATVDFNTTTGFDSADFAVKGVAVPNIPWLTFDADVSFGLSSKSVTLTPNINLGKFSCITLYYKLINGAVTNSVYDLTGIEFYGLKLDYTWNGVTFTDVTSLTGSLADLDSSLSSTYWELFKIASTGDSCCGGAVNFSVSNYFGTSTGKLFGWGETDVSLSFGIGSNYTINTGLVVDSSGLTKLSAGFKVTW